MTAKQLTWIFVGLGLLIAGLLVWYFFFRDDECDPNRNGYTKKGKPSNKCKAEDPKQSNTPPPAGTPAWIDDNTFPLKKGMWGSKVMAVQKALGIIPADGKFGSGTEAAVFAKFKENTVSKPNYDSLINPAAKGGGMNYENLKKNLTGAKNFSGGIYVDMPGQNKNYQFYFFADNGRFSFQEKGKTGSIKKGSYFDGGKKMTIDAGKSYEGSVYVNMREITNEFGQ